MKVEDVVTFHDLARYVAEREGKKEELSIAQISEVLSIVREYLTIGAAHKPGRERMERAAVLLGIDRRKVWAGG